MLTQAIIRRCSTQKLSWNVSQNSQECNCVEVFILINFVLVNNCLYELAFKHFLNKGFSSKQTL